MHVDLRLWNHLHCLAFDDVVREVCDIDGCGDPKLLADARHLTAQFLHHLSAREGLHADRRLAHQFERVLRGTFFVRFGERVCYWMDHLGRVEAEYARRVGVWRGGRMGADDLRPFVDRGEGMAGG